MRNDLLDDLLIAILAAGASRRLKVSTQPVGILFASYERPIRDRRWQVLLFAAPPA